MDDEGEDQEVVTKVGAVDPGGEDTLDPGGAETLDPGGEDTLDSVGEETLDPGGEDTLVPGGAADTEVGLAVTEVGAADVDLGQEQEAGEGEENVLHEVQEETVFQCEQGKLAELEPPPCLATEQQSVMGELARTGYSKLVGKSTQPVARKEKEEHKETVSVAGVPCDKEPEPPPQYYYTTGFNSKHHNKHSTFHHIPVNNDDFNFYFYFYDPIINYNPKHNYNRFTFNLYNNFTFNHLSLNYYHFNLYRLEGAMDIKQEQVTNGTNNKFGTFGGEANFGFQECVKAAVSNQQCDCSASYSTKQPGLSCLRCQ